LEHSRILELQSETTGNKTIGKANSGIKENWEKNTFKQFNFPAT